MNLVKGKFYLLKIGCHLNSIDTDRIRDYLIANHWEEIDDVKFADIIIFNTCAFVQSKIDECITIIVDIIKCKKTDAKLLLCGCLPVIDKSAIENICDVECLTPLTLSKLDQIIDAEIPFAEQLTSHRLLIDDEISKNRDIFFVRTNYGCLHNCSFCAVKKVFPNLRSKPIDTVLDEINKGIKEGCIEIGLTSEDLTAYGRDIGVSLIKLLQEIIEIKSNIKLSLYRFYPQYLIDNKDAYLQLLESGVIHYMSIPANSGSENILEKMGRKYSIGQLTELISQIKMIFPNVIIRSDIMIGHPGEEEEDFQKTIAYVINSNIDILITFPFCAMPGTRAFDMAGQIPQNVIDTRLKLLNSIFENKKKLAHTINNKWDDNSPIEKEKRYFRVSKRYRS
jgi:MiaB/RimO family radical SAM methylthiotransferase